MNSGDMSSKTSLGVEERQKSFFGPSVSKDFFQLFLQTALIVAFAAQNIQNHSEGKLPSASFKVGGVKFNASRWMEHAKTGVDIENPPSRGRLDNVFTADGDSASWRRRRLSLKFELFEV